MNSNEIVKAKLIAYRKSFYSTLVFENVDSKKQYIMCTVPPDWREEIPEINQVGFLNYESTIAGESTYIDKLTNQKKIHLYSNDYFIKFVPLINDNNNEVTIKIK